MQPDSARLRQASTGSIISEFVKRGAEPMRPVHPDRPRMLVRWIHDPNPDGWSDIAMSEWELNRAGWADLHQHTETNMVLAGELHVECGGTTVVCGPGDTVTVPAGKEGSYWAPVTARMLAIYGPNPDGHPMQAGRYWEITASSHG